MTHTQPERDFALGQRYIAAGAGAGTYRLRQVPGNALGAYLDGARIEAFCNVQDATGYAMRGGAIFIEKDAGYRCGIHMKEYEGKVPKIVIGGRCGSFLGEYQAGGILLVLGIGWEECCPVGNFCGTGMHGGKVFLRTAHLPPDLPAQVAARPAAEEDRETIRPLVEEYCAHFGGKAEALLQSGYFLLTPNSQNPYKQLYVHN